METEQQVQKEKQHSFVRRDRLREIEAQAQKLWAEKKFHEAQIKPGQKKYFGTFPYPYMNGKLHLGHAFSLTKTEFQIRFKRIQGYNVLFTQGFHCTGMPIQAAAGRIKRELEQFGNPPVFPVEEKVEKKEEVVQEKKQEVVQEKKQEKTQEEKKNDKNQQQDKNKKKDTKKKVDEAPKKPEWQYNILKKMQIPETELPKFVDPVHWLNYFPPLGQADLTKFGIHSDWRRTFITTDQNPYYNKFIEWQFLKLKQFGKIKFGKRPSIYSIIDKQMCADHDRSEGLGVNPQEYTLIKLQLVDALPVEVQPFSNRKVFLVAATLRPETMYGQTNCYILPEGHYGMFEMKNDEIFICSDRSALNMAAQEMTKTAFVVNKLGEIKGEKLIGQTLLAPLTKYEKVHVLPMKTISMTKGTGVVTSVPSDSPDDFANLRDYRNKKNLREYYHIKDEWVLPFEPIPIIEVPGLTTMLAELACEEYKVQSGNDKVNLAEAKEYAYKRGFYDGIMMIGDFKGQKVCDAKPKVQQLLISNGQACLYYEPEKLVISRSGDECVVAFCDQWYINYADEQWKNLLKTHTTDITKFQCYNDTALKEINATIDWLKEWGCSRSFGQGTRLPWDTQFLIESLSDSTIYFAYYTVAHYLQNNLNGSQKGIFNINPEDLNEQFWDCLYLDQPYPENCKIPKEQLNKMKEEFNYWYPMDIRCSGKDLIKNHLTMALFNHSAIWEKKPEFWPKSYFCNGYVQVDGEKMSKSLGNFYTVEEILNIYSADSVRIGCANAGDSLDDANFTLETCDHAILKLTTLETWIKEVIKHKGTLRSPDQKVDKKIEFFDQVFQSQINQKFCQIISSYENMRFRDVLKYGYYEFQNLKDIYRLNVEKSGMRFDLVSKYIEYQLAVLYPITPHFSEIIYHEDFYSQFLTEEQKKTYPEFISNYVLPTNITFSTADMNILRKFQLYDTLEYTGKVLVQKLTKNKNTKIKNATIIVSLNYFDWQVQVINLLKQGPYNETNEITTDWKKIIKDDYKVPGKELKNYYQFGQFILDDYKEHGQQAFELGLPFNEQELYFMFKDNLKTEYNVEDVQILLKDEAEKLNRKDFVQAIQTSTPGKPQIVFDLIK